MTTMSKLLALIPVVGFAAACGSMAPTGPNPVASNDATEISGNASTLTRFDCRGLAAVTLSIDDSNKSTRWVDATYHYAVTASGKCAPPLWKSNRPEMTLDKLNPMRAGFLRTAGGMATVRAQAPNGLNAEIQVKLGDVTRDPSGPSQCADVVGVALTLDPVADANQVRLTASYVHSRPFSTPCGIVPVWTADRRGLLISPKNPFQASINRSPQTKTTVTVSGPNGAFDSMMF